MATYTKETALYDTAAIATDISDAGTKATNYLAADSSGIMVYDGTDGAQTPSNPGANTNNVFIDDNSLDIRKGTSVLASFGEEVVVGEYGSGQLTLSSNGMALNNNDGATVLSIENDETATGETTIYESTYLVTGGYPTEYTLQKNPVVNKKIWVVCSTGSSLLHFQFTAGQSESGSGGDNITVTYDGDKYFSLTSPDNDTYLYSFDYTSTILVANYKLGINLTATSGSVAEGYGSEATGIYSHAEGQECDATGYAAHAEGYHAKATKNYSHAEGYITTASNSYAHAEGIGTTANGSGSHAEGNDTKATGTYTHAEGSSSEAKGMASHAEGSSTKTEATAFYSHAEGNSTTAGNTAAHSEGNITTASGKFSHSEGSNTTASGESSHSEGYGTTASGDSSHAEGYAEYPNNKISATGKGAHAEGISTSGNIIASGAGSHAEGGGATASGYAAHAEGAFTTASGDNSHAQNKGTIASSANQTALGAYNIEDANATYSVIVGNGTISARSNALTVDWSGNVVASGSITDGSGNVLSNKVNASSLATVAISGSYDDLSNKPSINGVTLTGEKSLVALGLLDFFYPVGSYYETSDTSFDPNTTWGGTWVQEVAGQVHVSAGTGYSISGALTNTSDGGSPYIQAHTHAHTNPSISGGAHVHTLNQRNAGTTGGRATNNVTYGASGHDYQTSNAFVSSGAHSHTVTGGGVGAVNGLPAGQTTGNAGNMPPYIVVNRWHRTA